MTGLQEHETTASGNVKSACVSNVLAALGIHPSDYKHTWNERTKKNVGLDIIRRNGYCARSRKSRIKSKTVGGARKQIKEASKNDPAGTRYVVRISGHMLLLDGEGRTIIDTAPRKRDARKILAIYAVYRAYGYC